LVTDGFAGAEARHQGNQAGRGYSAVGVNCWASEHNRLVHLWGALRRDPPIHFGPGQNSGGRRAREIASTRQMGERLNGRLVGCGVGAGAETRAERPFISEICRRSHRPMCGRTGEPKCGGGFRPSRCSSDRARQGCGGNARGRSLGAFFHFVITKHSWGPGPAGANPVPRWGEECDGGIL